MLVRDNAEFLKITMKGLIMWDKKSGQDCCLCFWRQSASSASFRPARHGPYNRICNRQDRFVSRFLPAFLLLPLGLLLCFPRGIFPLPVSIITVQSTPDTYGWYYSKWPAAEKSSRPFFVTWFVSLFFTHLLLTLLPGSCIDLHEVMWSRKFLIRQNMEIYRYLWRYFVARIPLDT